MGKTIQNNNNLNQQSLPKNWEIVPLENIAAKISDGSHNPPRKQESGLPMLSARNIENNRIVFNNFRYISEEDFEQENRRTNISPGDVLLTIVGTIGRSAIVPDKMQAFTVQRSVAVIKPIGIIPKFLMYQFQAPFTQKFFNDVARGTAQKGVYLKNLSKTPVRIAPISEQKRIVAEIEKQFSRLDEAVENLQRVKANLRRYKAAILKAAIEGKLTEQWRAENPGFESAEIILDSILAERRKKWEEAELSKMKDKEKDPKDERWKSKYKYSSKVDESLLVVLPNGWTWASLSQLGELSRGKSKHRPRNAPILYGGPYPFVQTGDVRNATGVIKQYTQTYSEEGLKQSRIWPKGTLCITIAANIADTAILGFDACFPDSIVGFIPENENIDVRFIEYFIRTAKEDLERYAPATAQKNINLRILSDVAVPLPPQEEQNIIIDEIAKYLTIAEGIEFDVELNMQRANRLRQSILLKAFSGALVKSIHGEEPATVLLDKVKKQRDLEKDLKPTTKKGKRSMTTKETYFSLEEVDADHLSKILAKKGAEVDPKSLWEESKLTIDDFYAQLKREVEGNLIEETPEKSLSFIA